MKNILSCRYSIQIQYETGTGILENIENPGYWYILWMAITKFMCAVSSCYLSITWICKAVNFGNIRYFNSYINSYQIIYIFHYECGLHQINASPNQMEFIIYAIDFKLLKHKQFLEAFDMLRICYNFLGSDIEASGKYPWSIRYIHICGYASLIEVSVQHREYLFGAK